MFPPSCRASCPRTRFGRDIEIQNGVVRLNLQTQYLLGRPLQMIKRFKMYSKELLRQPFKPVSPWFSWYALQLFDLGTGSEAQNEGSFMISWFGIFQSTPAF